MNVTILKDLRGSFGNIRNQDTRPTCLAFAISDAHAAMHKPFSPFSVDYLFYHAVQRMVVKNPKAPVSVEAASAALRVDGQPLDHYWPYQAVLPQDISQYVPPANCPVFRHTQSNHDMSFAALCKSIDSGVPVILVLKISDAFIMPGPGNIISFRSLDREGGSHAVIAVGHGRTAKEGCLLIRNSWGGDWALDGHAFIESTYLERRLILASAIT